MGQATSLPYWQKDLYDRNKPLTDEELDQLIPVQGYEVSVFLQSRLFLFLFIIHFLYPNL